MGRLLHRVLSVLYWAAVLVLGAFGIYFSVTNYPAFALAVALAIAILIGYSERNRRQRHRAADRARRLRRSKAHDPLT